MTQEDIDNVVLELKYGLESPSKALAFTKSSLASVEEVNSLLKICKSEIQIRKDKISKLKMEIDILLDKVDHLNLDKTCLISGKKIGWEKARMVGAARNILHRFARCLVRAFRGYRKDKTHWLRDSEFIERSREERDRVSEIRKLCQKWSNGKPVDGNPLSCSILNLPTGETCLPEKNDDR